MHSLRLVRTRVRRVLVVSLLVLGALTFVVLPANAGPRSATTAITDNGNCSFGVTYEWTGFPGTELVTEVALGYREAGGLNVVFAWADFPGKAGSGGSVSATFTLTGTPGTALHPYFGRGALLAPGKKGYTLSSLRDSVVYSGNVASQACGSTVTVSP